jgi:hypothetical protein
MMAVFRFRFASFRLKAKMMAVFHFRLASFRFEAKMMAVFRFFFVLFSFRSIFVSLQISTFRIDAKQAKKSLFFASKRKKFRFFFASFRFEAKMTAHPTALWLFWRIFSEIFVDFFSPDLVHKRKNFLYL